MLDFASCAYDMSVMKIICWYRNELTPFQLKGTNAFYFRQPYAVSNDFVEKLMNVITAIRPLEVEVHSNIVFTNVELYRVIACISKALHKDQIKIHLYDDGIRSIGERLELNRLNKKEFSEIQNSCQKYLDVILKHETNPFADYLRTSWPVLMHYSWHKFYNVTYHLMNQHDNLTSSGTTPFYKHIQKNTCTLKHADITSTDHKSLALCLSLLNLNISTINEIKKELKHENSLLYMGAGFFNREKDDFITEKQVAKINRMKCSGVIKNNDKIFFKAHPINHIDNRRKIIEALGDNVYTLPNHIPFEILPVIGLSPTEIICSFSTLLFTMQPTAFRHIIGSADTTRESLKEPLINGLIKANILKGEIVSGWLD